ncbi:hypothetical protein CLOSTMETH_00051 [[Clostridium] methylpentosum DSM 5476]|jgi:phenylacetate-CoA ligase|uniref:Phenylacetate-coenzyme A ligase n=1 Tax=[Clostridium] methylpentosum DSM 5476 TaxID=537013 RepID=C0E879_9FIRM|nr:hypothetical protein CLOSTMETH_00051 [[Clostridium] methylpentosum DSM 5476]MEE1492809.1 phenylacetate--CoA ligase [Massilioclostridium sp.]
MGKYFNPAIECADRETMVAIQNEKFIQMVASCYNNIPLYKERMDELGVKPEDIKSIEDLHKLPFTYKQDLRDNYPYGMLAVPRTQVSRIQATSGTTGKATVVGYTQKDVDSWAECVARALTAAGATSDDVIHVSYGYGLFTGGMGLHYGAEKLGATVIPVSSGNTKRQIDILRDLQSDYLCCTPSYAMYIGETLHEMGLTGDDIKLRGGVFGAEPWTPQMRREIERLLGIKAQDIYGLCEVLGPGVAFDCCEQNGLHINEDHFIAEIIDPDTGEVLPEGTPGELVFTCIQKEAMPLIRYRTRDIATLTREKCSCGRTLVKMTKPAGRTDDMLIVRGVNVFPSQIEKVLLDLKMTSPNYLIVVDRVNNMDKMEVQVEINQQMFSDTVRNLEQFEQEIKEALRATLNISAKVRLVEPKTIARSEGKAKRVIDNRKLHE